LTAGALLCGECGTSAIAPRPTLGDTERHDRRTLLEAIAREASARGSAATDRASAPAMRTSAAHHASAPVDRADVAVAPDSVPAPSVAGSSVPDSAAGASVLDSGRHAAAGAEEPPVVARSGALFSLVFSTGESVRVSGSGLVGRNPAAREGESFDYLVQIVDPERSVSKTHFEFGVDGDRLWIADRGSANGTRVGLDLVDPIDLVPGERMRIPRGTRVGIGDQYVDVH
jgi:hypothetical protein